MGRPGTIYTVGRSLYVALTNRSSTTTLIATRGPGFSFGKSFTWLADGYEPTAGDVIESVEEAIAKQVFKDWDRKNVVFAGGGEPLLRPSTLVEICQGLKKCDFRVVTNGLFCKSVVTDYLLGNVSAVSVALNAHNEETYLQIMQPVMSGFDTKIQSDNSSALGIVQSFIQECRRVGLDVEVTCIDRVDVDVQAVKRFAEDHGATFRLREFFPASGL